MENHDHSPSVTIREYNNKGELLFSYINNRECHRHAIDLIKKDIEKKLDDLISFNSSREVHDTRQLLRFAVMERILSSIECVATLFDAGLFWYVTPYGRMSMDAVARFNGSFHVEDPQAYCSAIFDGKHLSNFRDEDGNELKDGRLQALLSKRCPYSLKLYKVLSGDIHLGKTSTARFMTEDSRRISDSVYNATVSPDIDREWNKESRSVVDHTLKAILTYRYVDIIPSE